jgi:cytochrome oxidase Cu insertion factor (SCO1/SenC/PrrC family)
MNSTAPWPRPGGSWALAALAGLLLMAAAAPAHAGSDKVLEDLLRDLQLIPFDGQTPPPFALERLDNGKKVTLAEHRGRVVLLYFWATW